MHIYLASHLDNAQGSKFFSENKKKIQKPLQLAHEGKIIFRYPKNLLER